MQFDANGNQPKDAKPICFLPADAEFAARGDTRRYLQALISDSPTAIADAANVPYSPFSPVGTCPLSKCLMWWQLDGRGGRVMEGERGDRGVSLHDQGADWSCTYTERLHVKFRTLWCYAV